MIVRRLLFLLIFASITLSSCSFIGDDKADGAITPIENPDLVLTNATYTLGQSGEHPLFITGTKMTIWEKDHTAYLEDFTFYQLDEKGERSLTGKAKNAKVDTEKKTCSLTGDVTMQETEHGYKIVGEDIFFDSETQNVTGNGQIVVDFDGGHIEGSDFQADLKKGVFLFGKIGQGSVDK